MSRPNRISAALLAGGVADPYADFLVFASFSGAGVTPILAYVPEKGGSPVLDDQTTSVQAGTATNDDVKYPGGSTLWDKGVGDVTLTLHFTPAGNGGGIAFNCTGSNTGWAWRAEPNNGAFKLRYLDGANPNEVESYSGVVPVAGTPYDLKLVVSLLGTRVDCYVNGALVKTHVDAVRPLRTATMHGLASYAANGQTFDDFTMASP